MQFTLFTVLASIAVGTHAAVLPRQGTDNPRLAQFRVYSAGGCSDLNSGFYTIDTDQADQCHDVSDAAKFTPYGYVSIELQAKTVAATQKNCTLLLYSDISCLEGATEAPLAVCENATVVQAGNAFPTWNSYYYKCDS